MFSLSRIGLVSNFYFNAIDDHAEALHGMELLFGDSFKVTSEFCMAGMDNDFHKANNVTLGLKM